MTEAKTQRFLRIFREKLAKIGSSITDCLVLLQFSFSNFRAFRGVQTLNLAASNYDKDLLENCIDSEVPSLSNRRWLKGIALYGPNASGKSSVIEALQALSRMVTQSAKVTDPQERISYVQPFALAPEDPPCPTAFGISFVSDKIRYEYRVAAVSERVHHESLRAFRKTKKEDVLFSRQWNPEKDSYSWSSDEALGYKRDKKKEEFTLPNVLYLSKAISLGDRQLEPVFRWFRNNLKFVDLSARVPHFGADFTAEQFQNKTHLAPKVLKLLQEADLGINNVVVSKESMPEMVSKILDRLKDMFPADTQENLEARLKDGGSMKVALSHQGKGQKSIPLPWDMESAGTHRLFALAGPWLDILENGYTVCVDEIETSMHPLMVAALLKLLFCEKNNPNGAQVIFTTHNPLLLDPTLIRRDQVWFSDKDEQGEAHLYPLTDYAPRKDESLIRGYLAGRYGAVPFIPEGFLGSFNKHRMSEEATDE